MDFIVKKIYSNRIYYFKYIYLREGGYVIVVVCLSVCLFLSVSNFAQKKFRTDLHGIFREGWQWANEQLTLLRRALAEICTVPVLL